MPQYKENPLAAIASKFINNTNCHIFLTGKAGTGKTTFLRNISQYTHKNTIIAAPTGIAAINAGGVTLHSLFQLPYGTFIPSNDIKDSKISIQLNTPKSLISNFQMHKTKRAMIREMELLIIDEVSMLRADLLDAIDNVLRYVRRNSSPFGGVQILFIGDLMQLPPVVKEDEREYLAPWYSGINFFNAQALKTQKPLYIELDKIYRQTDQEFIDLLNNIRDNKMTESDISLFNKYYKPDFKPDINDGYINLVTHNRLADDINRVELEKIPGKTYKYDAQINKDFSEHQYPVDYTLELKKGSQVMFIKNDPTGEQMYYNGKIGVVSALDDDLIKVSFNDGSPSAIVERYMWLNKKFSLNKDTNIIEEDVKGTFSQYPLKLAWAITIHKSQGLTFEKAIIDVSRAFAAGQIYVALSRLTSLDGLVLTAPIPSSGIMRDSDIREFEKSKENSSTLDDVLKLETHRFVIDIMMKAFNFSFMINQLGYHIESYNKDERRSIKQQYRAWAIDLRNEVLPVKAVADKFLGQILKLSQNNNEGSLEFLMERTLKAKEYFEPLLKNFSEKVFELIKSFGKEKGIKKYITELKDIEHLFFKQLQYIYKAEALIKSAIENTELVKDTMNESALLKERQEDLDKNKISNKKKKKLPKEKKENTKDISFKLFKEGKTIAEISKERSLVVSTIEGHMAHFVAQGDIEITDMMDKKKAKKVIEVANKIDEFSLNAVKGKLGKEYSYGDIKIALAWKKFKDDETK